MFQIWVNAAESAYMLIDNLQPDEAKALEAEGCRKVQDLKAPEGEAAKKEFIEFCELHQPGNTVNKAERVTLLGLACKAIGEPCRPKKRSRGGPSKR